MIPDRHTIRRTFEGYRSGGGRFVYFGTDESREGQRQTVPEEEKYDERKKEARGAIDAVYELEKYDTYNFRKLPEAFKSGMKENFGQWIDANIAKYDEDKNSGIDAEEYRKFKEELNRQVEGILDRLAGLVQEKKEQAEEMKESAEEAQEAQKRLEGMTQEQLATLDRANLDSADGTLTEFLKYQAVYKNEVKAFQELSATFGGAKEKVDAANKPSSTGLGAVGDYARNHPVIAGTLVFPGVGTMIGLAAAALIDDSPEVAAAKKAKEDAIADFREKLSKMRSAQSKRQKTGKELNAAPEKLKGKVAKEYADKKSEVKTKQEAAEKKRRENTDQLEKFQRNLRTVQQSRTKLQESYTRIALASAQAADRERLTREKEGEMATTGEGLEKAADLARKGHEQAPGAAPEQASQSASGQASPLPRQLEKARLAAVKAQKDIAAELRRQGIEIEGMGSTMTGLQTQVVKLNQYEELLNKGIGGCNANELALAAETADLAGKMDGLKKEEKGQLDQLDSLDGAIAGTVIEVETSNFELIKKGDEYLAMLTAMNISGPGILDSAGAALRGIPGVDTALDWAGDKLAAGWEWAKGAPALGSIIDTGRWAGGKWVAAWDSLGSGLVWVGDKLHLQEAWDWMNNASTILANTQNTALSWAGGLGGTVIEVFAGVTEAAKDVVKSLGMIGRNPFDLVKGLGALANHPESILSALVQADKWGTESPSKIIGRMMFDVITTCTGAGAVADGVKMTLSAIKLGKMTLREAINEGLKMFAKTFVKDVKDIFKGVAHIPTSLKNVAQGLGEMAKTIAGGGKRKPPSPAKALELAETARKAARAEEEAYLAVKAVEEMPPGPLKKQAFRELMGKYGIEALDKYASRARKLKKSAAPQSGNRPAKVAEENVPAVAEKPGPKKPVRELPPPRKARAQSPEPAAAKSAETARVAKAQSEAPDAGAKAKTDTEGIPLPAKPDLEPKPLTPQRKALYDRINSSPMQKTVKNKMELAKKTAYLDAVKQLPDKDLKFLADNLDKIDPLFFEKILKQEYFILQTEKGPVRYYVGKSISGKRGSFGEVSECLYAAEEGGNIRRRVVKTPYDPVAMKAELDGLLAKGMKNLSDDERHRMAKINEFLANWQEAFKIDMETNKVMSGMSDVPHLLIPDAMPKAGQPYAFISPEIKPLAGRKDVGMDNLMESADIPPENILQLMENVSESGEGLLKHGYLPTDLNPKNVFVGTIDGEAVTRLGDLGLVRFEDIPNARFASGSIKNFPLEHYLHFTRNTFGYAPGKTIPAVIRDKPVIGHLYKFFEGELAFLHKNPQVLPAVCRGKVLQGLDALTAKMKNVNSDITLAEARAEYRRLRLMIEDARPGASLPEEILPLAA